MIRLAGIAVAAAIVLLGGFMVWHGPRCSGPLPSDRCPIVATVAPKGDRLAVRVPPEEAAAVVLPVEAMPSPPAPLPWPAPVAPAPAPPAARAAVYRDVCAAQGMRKEYFRGRGGWQHWRCVRR